MIYPSNDSPTVESIRRAVSVSNPPSVVYRLEASTELPSIDCSKAIKDVVLSKGALKRYNACIRALRPALRVGFAIGLVLAWGGSFFDRRTGNVLLVISPILILIPTLIAILALRFDMVVLLVKTYEFRYFSFVSLISSVMLGANYGDQRASLFVGELFLYEFALLMDANTRGVRGAISASTIGALALLMFVALQELGQVKDYGNVTVLNYGTWKLHGSDVVATGLTNISTVFFRNAYRKRLAVKNIHRHHKATVRCISYRIPLRFAQVSRSKGGLVPLPRTETVTERHQRLLSSVASTTTSQLRLVPLNFHINADDPIQRWIMLPPVTSSINQQMWTSVGVLGLAATVMAVVTNDGRHPNASHNIWIASLGFSCSIAYTVRGVCFHNHRLLRHITWSFDFLFLTVQSNVAHVILWHLLRWDPAKCLAVGSSWCWTYWLLTLDLLTPDVRKRLGIRSSRLPIIVIVLLMAGHLWLAQELLFSRRWQIDDRVLLGFKVGEKTVEIFAVPVLLTRMMTILCWWVRLLWRLWFQSVDELILTQGAVEYDNYDMLRRLEAPKHDSRVTVPGQIMAS